jgi:hypothetical protein
VQFGGEKPLFTFPKEDVSGEWLAQLSTKRRIVLLNALNDTSRACRKFMKIS